MSEFMTIHPSHFECIKLAVLTGLRQMYTDGSCPSLGIGIKISGVSLGPSVIDPNKGCYFYFLRTYIFIDAYHSQGWGRVEKTHQEIFLGVFI